MARPVSRRAPSRCRWADRFCRTLHFLALKALFIPSKAALLCQRSRCSLSRWGWRFDQTFSNSPSPVAGRGSPRAGSAFLVIPFPPPDLARYRAARRPFGCLRSRRSPSQGLEQGLSFPASFFGLRPRVESATMRSRRGRKARPCSIRLRSGFAARSCHRPSRNREPASRAAGHRLDSASLGVGRRSFGAPLIEPPASRPAADPQAAPERSWPSPTEVRWCTWR